MYIIYTRQRVCCTELVSRIIDITGKVGLAQFPIEITYTSPVFFFFENYRPRLVSGAQTDADGIRVFQFNEICVRNRFQLFDET